jgi:cell division protein FtsB
MTRFAEDMLKAENVRLKAELAKNVILKAELAALRQERDALRAELEKCRTRPDLDPCHDVPPGCNAEV